MYRENTSEGTPKPDTWPMWRGPLAYGHATAVRTLLVMNGNPSLSLKGARSDYRPRRGHAAAGATRCRLGCDVLTGWSSTRKVKLIDTPVFGGLGRDGCRSCGAATVSAVLELGDQPVADDLFDDADAALQAPRYGLSLGSCGDCGLIQLDPATPAPAVAAHGHGSAYSPTVLEHENQWAQELLALPHLGDRALVLDTSSGDGGLLRPFAIAGHTVRGWERDGALAARASAAGLPTAHLDGNHDHEAGQYDVVLANHTLSHADDVDAAVQTLSDALAPGGTLAVEFHSAMGILTGGQFDMISHAHRSYLSLTSLHLVLERHGLVVTTAKTLPLHGGVVRIQASSANADRHRDDTVA
ncbi:MAG TPA: methyltransferase domain-containing protein, partial [Propionibacteriaceae bacterium]|nr:methyltransferase domain-containing protein [Propionibacteriaceae bacterium]